MKTALIYFVDGSSIRVSHEDGLYKKLRSFNEGIFTDRPFISVTDEDGEDVLINVATVTRVKPVTHQ